MSRYSNRRPLKFDCLRDTVREVHRLHDSYYTMAGNWDLAKACRHLSKTMRMSIEGAPFNLPFFLKPVARWVLFRSVMTGAPTRLPLKTVKQFSPEDASDVSVEIAEYEKLVEVILSDDAPLLEVHPVFGRISKDQWRTFHAWHAAHHLSFLIPSDADGSVSDSTSATPHSVSA